MKRLDVIGLGLAAVDVVIVVDAMPTWEVPGKAYELQIGGGGPAATATVAAAHLGCCVGFVGTYGCDDFGSRKRDELTNAGLDVSRMVRRDYPEDQIIIVYVERATGERIFVSVARETPGGHSSLVGSELDKSYIQSAGILHIDGSHPDAARHAAHWIRDAGGKLCAMWDWHPIVATIDTRPILNMAL